MAETLPQTRPVLHVCVTCRRGLPLTDDPVQGRQFYEALARHAEKDNFSIQPVDCMATCSRGCVAAVSMPEKWTLILGQLGPEKIEDLRTFLGLYRASKTGTVMPSKRPASLSDMILARLPASLSVSQELS